MIGRTKGGMNTKLHAVTDRNGRPLDFFMTAGHISDYTGAAALLDSLPSAEWMLADRGYDADWFREALEEKGIKPCIPGRKSRSKPVKYANGNTKDATVLKSCSAGSKTGDGSQHAMTDARPSSSRQSASLQPSCSGYES